MSIFQEADHSRSIAKNLVRSFRYGRNMNKAEKGSMSTKNICLQVPLNELSKSDKDYVREQLIANSFTPRANNNIPIFEDMDYIKFLTNFTIIDEECKSYELIQIDKANLSDEDLMLYNKYVKKADTQDIKNTSKSSWERFMLENQLEYPQLNPHEFIYEGGFTIDLEKDLIDYKGINYKLPDGAYLVNYNGVPYYYCKTHFVKNSILEMHQKNIIDREILLLFLVENPFSYPANVNPSELLEF